MLMVELCPPFALTLLKQTGSGELIDRLTRAADETPKNIGGGPAPQNSPEFFPDVISQICINIDIVESPSRQRETAARQPMSDGLQEL